MVDYDWLPAFRTSFAFDQWTDRSKHPDTALLWYFNGSMFAGYNVVHSETDNGHHQHRRALYRREVGRAGRHRRSTATTGSAMTRLTFPTVKAASPTGSRFHRSSSDSMARSSANAGRLRRRQGRCRLQRDGQRYPLPVDRLPRRGANRGDPLGSLVGRHLRVTEHVEPVRGGSAGPHDGHTRRYFDLACPSGQPTGTTPTVLASASAHTASLVESPATSRRPRRSQTSSPGASRSRVFHCPLTGSRIARRSLCSRFEPAALAPPNRVAGDWTTSVPTSLL